MQAFVFPANKELRYWMCALVEQIARQVATDVQLTQRLGREEVARRIEIPKVPDMQRG